MSWPTVVWSMAASAALTLGAFHVLVALRQRSRASLVFAISALGAAAIAACELSLMHARTPEQYGQLLRLIHIPILVMVVSLVLFVRFHLGAGRPWLGWIVIVLRGAATAVNFLRTPNLNFDEITGLRRIRFLGEEVAVAEGTVSAWTRLGEASTIALLVFLVDATIQVWRREDHRRVAVGFAIIAFVLLASGITSLIHADLLRTPYLISFWFLGLVFAMTYELSADVLRAQKLSRDLLSRETALRERDVQLSLAGALPDLAFWSWDAARDEVWMTENGRALRGFAPEERLGLARLLSRVHPEDREAFEKTVRGALEQGATFQREHRILPPGGEVHWISTVGRGDWEESGGSARVRAVSIDVTPRKTAELEAQRQRVEIAHLSRVSTLGELSGSIAHELNQPLAAILANAQAAQRILGSNGEVPQELREILEDIVRDDKHAGEVIRRLRRFLKKGEESLEVLDPQEVIVEALRLMRTELMDRGVSIDSDISPGLAPIRADRVQLQQVLVNLVSNACDAVAELEPSRRRLILRAGPCEGGLRVSVSDQGNGIPESDLERIFAPYVTTKENGMGMGLAVCRTIVASHGGRLWAVNNPGGGATLAFTIPDFEGERS